MSMEWERTFAYLKPNAVRRGLVGVIIQRFEQRGLKIVALKMGKMTLEQSCLLYQEHREKPFFQDIVQFVTSGPSIFMLVDGPRAIELTRHIIGDTDPLKAGAGTIRADFSVTVTRNLIHASDSPGSFAREWPIFFSEFEILKYRLDVQDDL